MKSAFNSPATARLLLRGLIACALLTPLSAIMILLVQDWGRQAAAAEKSYVIILRHGDAPGRNEPQNFALDDCSTQRNLSDKGRNEARELGRWLRNQHINITQVVASRWCRARDTARLLNVGPVESEPTFDNLEFNKDRKPELLDQERKLIASWNRPGVLLIVTHSSNIKELSGLELGPGAMILANRTSVGDIDFRLSNILLKDFFS
jgi:phosphohistidine phosphatase SixA